MKARLIILIAMLATVAAWATVFELSTGYGQLVDVTTAPQILAIMDAGTTNAYATSISVYNAGTSTVFAAVNSTASVFSTMMTAKTAIPIAEHMSYTFGGKRLESLCVATTNGTATAYVGAH